VSATPDAAPADANSLRFAEFRRLLVLPETRLWIAGPAGGLLLFGLLWKPSTGWVLPFIAIAVGLGVVFWIADRNAANAFWDVYASARALVLGGRTRLPERTPLLRAGDDRYTTRTLEGQIAPGLVGTLALFTYEEETRGLNGQRETAYHDFTLATVELPECAPYMGELYVRPWSAQLSLEEFGEAVRGSRQRVTLESKALDDRYEIFVAKDQDEIWTRRLFSPPFIVWLADAAPKKLSLELVDGALVAYLPKHKEDAESLDALAAATATVARRLLEESAQTS
jgi:hypothetical protein